MVERTVSSEERQKILKNADEFKTLTLNEEQVKDVKNIARGVYSPLDNGVVSSHLTFNQSYDIVSLLWQEL